MVGSNGIISSELFLSSEQFERNFRFFSRRHLFELSTPFSLLGLHFNAWLASWSCIDGVDHHLPGWQLWFLGWLLGSLLEFVFLTDRRYASSMFFNLLLDFFLQLIDLRLLLFVIVKLRVLVFFL